MQVLYGYFQSDDATLALTEKELFYSIQKSYDLYHLIFLLITDIAKLAESKIELGRQKMAPVYDDLHPNCKFIDNRVVKQISENNQLNNYLITNKLSWANHSDLAKELFEVLLQDEEYKKYLSSKSHSYHEDQKFVVYICTEILANSELFYQEVEDQSIYWNDDVEFMLSMAIKTIREMTASSDKEMLLLPLFKNSDDKEFVKTLLRKTVLNHQKYRTYIADNTKNWVIERIAYLDIILIMLAITEIMEFSSIPTKVTFNEYIEISKYYSTDKSSTFINGILDKIIHNLEKNKEFAKEGRGLKTANA